MSSVQITIRVLEKCSYIIKMFCKYALQKSLKRNRFVILMCDNSKNINEQSLLSGLNVRDYPCNEN